MSISCSADSLKGDLFELAENMVEDTPLGISARFMRNKMLKQALIDQDYVVSFKGDSVTISFNDRETANELFEFIGSGGLLKGMNEIEATEMRRQHAREYLEFMGKKTAEFYRNRD